MTTTTTTCTRCRCAITESHVHTQRCHTCGMRHVTHSNKETIESDYLLYGGSGGSGLVCRDCPLPTFITDASDVDNPGTERRPAMARVIEYDQVGMSAESRCDRCGSQAFVEVLLRRGAVLLFCAHHGDEHDEKIMAMNAQVADHRPFLIAQAQAAQRKLGL